MKMNAKNTALFVSLVAAGLLAASASQAATIPANQFAFTAEASTDVFPVKAKGWRDPAFGDMGWTHSSAWGTFSAMKGQTVTINMVAVDAGIHPGITVWYRGADDTADNKYVVDHFYPQNANFAKFGAIDETTGEKLGNIIMRHVTHGYDVDGNQRLKAMNPVKDGVAGQLKISFKAPKEGDYMFVVGGVNPDASVDTKENPNHDVNVTVTVAP
jgi:hypothetical protein